MSEYMSPINSGGWVLAYASEDGKTTIEHVDGIDWCDAPAPPMQHECWAQTRGWTNYFTLTLRCACGAISRDGKEWAFVNERRLSRAENVKPPEPHIDFSKVHWTKRLFFRRSRS